MNSQHAPTATPASTTDAAPAESEPVIGYVLKMYPRFSETFVVSEILAREAAGEKLVIFSLRPPADARFHAELSAVQAPVIQIARTSNASRMWQRIRTATSDPAIHPRLPRVLPDLLAADADEAHQAALVAQAALAHGVTHLHAHFASVSTTVARLAAALADLPYSFTAHAKDIFHQDVDQHLLAQKFDDAHHAVTISSYNMDHLRQRFPDQTDRLHLVYNGLHLPRFPYAPVGDQTGTPRILGVGRLVEKKGFSLLVDAVAALRDRDITVKVSIVGDGPLSGALQDQIAAAGLEDRVHLLGPRTQAEVTELMGTHDVFAAPFVVGSDGNADGLPTVLLEAMARGIRCVAADVTAVAEVIHSGDDQQPATGWLVPTGDVQALTEALIEAIQPGDHSAITDAARALVQERFDSARQAAHLRALTQQAPGRRSNTSPDPDSAPHSAPRGAQDTATDTNGVSDEHPAPALATVGAP